MAVGRVHGPYNRVERSRIVDVPYQRYPRTPIPPPSVELTVARDVSRDMVVVTRPLAYVDGNKEALLHRVNLMRELFGEAELLTEDLAPSTTLSSGGSTGRSSLRVRFLGGVCAGASIPSCASSASAAVRPSSNDSKILTEDHQA